MNLNQLIKNIHTTILKEDEDYMGNHTAPETNPLHDLVDVYGEDIYGKDAVRLHGVGVSYDTIAVNIIKSVRNKPNAKVIIYRSVPDINKDLTKRITGLNDLLKYYRKFEFYPRKNSLHNEIEKRYLNKDGYINTDKYTYKEVNDNIYDDIVWEINILEKKLVKMTINTGDWITTVKQYAIDHGKSHLNNRYKTLQKTVRACEIFNDGDIHEYGYQPQ
jgi:hypothetical protein